MIDALPRKGVGFRSLQEQIDTTSAGGRFYLHILAALAEFERELISECTRAGMAAAKAGGKHVGRPRKLTGKHIAQARLLIESSRQTRAGVALKLGVDVATLRRALRAQNTPFNH